VSIRGVDRWKLDNRTCPVARRANPAVDVLGDDRSECGTGVGVGVLISVVGEDDEFAAFGCRTGGRELAGT
jgi:hypothetical protein